MITRWANIITAAFREYGFVDHVEIIPPSQLLRVPSHPAGQCSWTIRSFIQLLGFYHCHSLLFSPASAPTGTRRWPHWLYRHCSSRLGRHQGILQGFTTFVLFREYHKKVIEKAASWPWWLITYNLKIVISSLSSPAFSSGGSILIDIKIWKNATFLGPNDRANMNRSLARLCYDILTIYSLTNTIQGKWFVMTFWQNTRFFPVKVPYQLELS